MDPCPGLRVPGAGRVLPGGRGRLPTPAGVTERCEMPGIAGMAAGWQMQGGR